MTVRIPAPEIVQCPKCGNENIGRKIYIWLVSDERGPHYECSACAQSWRSERQQAYVG